MYSLALPNLCCLSWRLSGRWSMTASGSACKAAIAFEDITYIRRLYRRGSGQGRNYRSTLNCWLFGEIKRLITYKAAWEGVRIIQLSVKETRGISQLCPRCGKKFAQGVRRELWCDECRVWIDRDVAATMNLSFNGRSRLSVQKTLEVKQ
jgi:IS605 OrfB family transposase